MEAFATSLYDFLDPYIIIGILYWVMILLGSSAYVGAYSVFLDIEDCSTVSKAN